MNSIIDNILNDSNINQDFRNRLAKTKEEEQLFKQIELYKKLEKNIKEFADLKLKIWENTQQETEWRNTKFSYWKDICLNYGEDNLLNCYGDIFYIDEKHDSFYIGRRVLWNLQLSKEQYYIEEFNYEDEIDYEISVKFD